MDEIYENSFDSIEEMTAIKKYVKTKSKVGFKKDYYGDDVMYPSFNATVNLPLAWPYLTTSHNKGVVRVSLTNREDLANLRDSLQELLTEVDNAFDFFERKSHQLSQNSKEQLSELQKAILEEDDEKVI